LVCVAGTAFGTAWPAAAQEIQATPTSATDRAPSLEQLARGGQVALSLDDAIAIALAHNLDVELQRLGPRLADTDLTRASAGGALRGVPLSIREGPRSVTGTSDLLFPSVGLGTEANLSVGSATSGAGRLPPSQDPVIVAGVRRAGLEQPQPNSFSVGTSELVTKATTASLGFQQGFFTGGEVSVSFDNAFTSTNNRRYDLNPFTASSLSLTFAQPLLRGFGRAVNQRYLRVARNTLGVSDLVFEQQVVTTVASVVRLYWDLVSLNEDVGVRRQALERTERLLADTEAHAEVGTRARIDVVRARAEVARSRRDLIGSEGLARQQETVLRDYLSGDSGAAPLVALRIVPSDPLPGDLGDPPPASSALTDVALRARPELAQARLQIENTRILLAGSRDATRPALDAIATVRSNGLAGTINPLTLAGAAAHTAIPELSGGYGSVLHQLGSFNFPDYVVGLQMTIPLRNRAAEADYARDQLVLRQQEIRVQQIENQIRVEIENALVALDQARASVDASRQERTYQEQALAAEIDRLTVGASTTYLVIQYQRDLAQARSAEVAALAAFVKAQAAVARASGQLLDRYGISAHQVFEDGR
jgi:outer membrane protein TolC